MEKPTLRFPKVKANRWHMPIMKNYKMACCDCGLVHNMSFKIIDSESQKPVNGRVLIKASRNEKLTKQLRNGNSRKNKNNVTHL